MKNKEPQHEPSDTPLTVAADAIRYTLGRIRDDENFRYHMGESTEAYERLKRAHALLSGETDQAIDESVLDKPLHRRPAVELLREIEDTINTNVTTAPAEVIEMILNIII